MRRFAQSRRWFACLALLAGASFAREPGPHAHGVATLRVAVDGGTLSLSFESPLDNLLGFERAPRSDAEKAAVRVLRERLHQPQTLFVPTPAARCSTKSATFESPVWEQRGDKSGHADLDAEFIFTCERPEELRDLEVRLFDSFPRMRRIDVQVAAPRGQAAARLSPAERRVAW